MRYCECGRQLEKYQKKECSECVAINIQISKDCYATTDEYKQSQDKYNKSNKGKTARHKADKKWRENNKEKNKIRLQKWKSENKNKVSEYNKKYYLNKKMSV